MRSIMERAMLIIAPPRLVSYLHNLRFVVLTFYFSSSGYIRLILFEYFYLSTLILADFCLYSFISYSFIRHT